MARTAAGLVISLALAAASVTAQQPGAPPADAAAFAGRWEQASDDGTSKTVIEIASAGGSLTGAIAEIERGYFSGRETIKGEYVLRGTIQGATASVTLSEAGGGQSIRGTLSRRGKFLVLRVGDEERGFARPGVALVEDPGRSPEAAQLAQTIQGRVFASATSGGGRGAFVGRRMRVAFCGDGRVEYDASDLASTGAMAGGGVDAGSSIARRGTWTIVLFAGAPAVMARWNGTGTSYSLTRYFAVRPAADGAVIDGIHLPVAGSC